MKNCPHDEGSATNSPSFKVLLFKSSKVEETLVQSLRTDQCPCEHRHHQSCPSLSPWILICKMSKSLPQWEDKAGRGLFQHRRHADDVLPPRQKLGHQAKILAKHNPEHGKKFKARVRLLAPDFHFHFPHLTHLAENKKQKRVLSF
jgi:hypothetical protein